MAGLLVDTMMIGVKHSLFNNGYTNDAFILNNPV